MKRLLVFFVTFLCGIASGLAQGTQIKDSESATHEADSSTYRIVDTYKFPGFKVIQFSLPVLSVYSYLLISGNEALMVDPVRDVSFYLEAAQKEGVAIKGVYLTHSHADFVAGHLEIVKKLNCPIYQSHKSGVRYRVKAVDENSIVRIGQAVLKFLDTPGHTPDGMCCAVYGKDQGDIAKLLFTGDVLFVGSVGRPDLLEGSISAAWLAGATFDSWNHKLAKLPDSVMVLPAHGAGSLCGAHLSADPTSTIGKEKQFNPYLKYARKSEFIAAVLDGLPEAPQYFKHDAKLNREGPPSVKWGAPLPTGKGLTRALTDPEKYDVVDIRTSKTYSEGHIPNSINISLKGRFETWVGTMVPWGAKLVLVGNDADELNEGIWRLHRIGYSASVITMDSWKKAKLPVVATVPITPRELHKLMEQGEAPIIVDVRLPSEWIGLRIGTVVNLPLNRLPMLSAQLDPQDAVVVMCSSGYRSSIAAGILERKGFKKVRMMNGGTEAWIEEGLPVFQAAGSATTSGPNQAAKPDVLFPERRPMDEGKIPPDASSVPPVDQSTGSEPIKAEPKATEPRRPDKGC